MPVMSENKNPEVGTIGWVDLTVENASEVRDFYAAVAGWVPSAVDMGDYSDFSMNDGGGNCVAGVCHARGTNASIPPSWLIYIVVADVEAAAAKCRELGGEVLVGPKAMGGNAYCIIRDPAGAVCALYENAG